jgi:methylthioribulose-1-phosphate dehydratase
MTPDPDSERESGTIVSVEMEPARAPAETWYDERELHAASEALCGVAAGFHARGWCLGTSGNFSVTLQDDPLRLLITQSGRSKGHLHRDDLVVVDPGGRPARGHHGTPSAEAILHVLIAGSVGAGSVLHTHSVCGTLLGEHYMSRGGFTIAGYEMLKGLKGIDTHDTSVLVPILENSQDMAELRERAKALLAEQPDLHGFLVAGHGLYTWGETLEVAQRHVEIFEFLFECVARRTRFVAPKG